MNVKQREVSVSDLNVKQRIVFSRNDYEVLIHLYNNDYIAEINAPPIKKIKEEVELSPNKIRQALKNFIIVGYVDEGTTIGKAKTYYITNRGIDRIEKMLNIKNRKGE